MTTLNQEIEILKNFSLKHKQIKSFYFGDEWETDSVFTPTYPLMNVVLQGAEKVGDMINRKFLIILSDLVNKDESNENHVLSDIELICYDLINYMNQVARGKYLGAWKCSYDTSLTDFTERGDSEETGYFFELTTSTNIGNYGCNLPISDGNILDDNYIYVGQTIETPSGFLVVIKDTDNNVIQEFSTNGTYTVQILQSILDTINGNTSTIIEPLT